jgi:hypothetical protein
VSFLPQAADVCGLVRFGLHSPLDVVQFVGALLIPAVAVILIARVSRRNPTRTLRWTSRRFATLLGHPTVMPLGLLVLTAGVLIFGASIFVTADGGDGACNGLAALGPLGLFITLVGAMSVGLTEAVTKQAGWVVLATFFVLDLWIVFGMVMMHLESNRQAPEPMLLLAFIMHAVCMYLTMVWAFHARNLSTMAQIRAGEAGRSIGAVWLFLAAYILVGFFQREQGPFDSAAGGAVLSALTLSALALTMGSGYTKYREVMAEEVPDAGGLLDTSPEDAVGAAVDVHRVTAQKGDQAQA